MSTLFKFIYYVLGLCYFFEKLFKNLISSKIAMFLHLNVHIYYKIIIMKRTIFLFLFTAFYKIAIRWRCQNSIQNLNSQSFNHNILLFMLFYGIKTINTLFTQLIFVILKLFRFFKVKFVFFRHLFLYFLKG